MAVETARWQFTVADYAKMGESGILREDDRVELIDGEIRPMSPIGPTHAFIIRRTMNIVVPRIFGRFILDAQNPLVLDDYSQPQLDLMILKQRDDFYLNDLPHAEDVLIVIEVSDTSLDFDRNEKLPRYATSGIAEAWIVNIAAQTVEQYTQPLGSLYATKRTFGRGETVVAQTVDFQVDVDTLFG